MSLRGLFLELMTSIWVGATADTLLQSHGINPKVSGTEGHAAFLASTVRQHLDI